VSAGSYAIRRSPVIRAVTRTTVIDPQKGGLMDNFFSDDELEITELPEREEMLSVLGLVDVTGLGGVLGAIFPISVNLGG
jgi:hypothetical protein